MMTKLKNEVNAKLYYELKKEIFEEEYYNTISSDWATNFESYYLSDYKNLENLSKI